MRVEGVRILRWECRVLGMLIVFALMSVRVLQANESRQDIPLGQPPFQANPSTSAESMTALRGFSSEQLAVDPLNRSSVAAFFNTTYRTSQDVPMNWTGKADSCDPGAISQNYQDATILRVNFYRAMAGLPTVTLSPELNAKCQAAALMMAVQQALSHAPDPGWACYSSDGAGAAGKSNLALGRAGPDAIDLFMEDSGEFNTAVGHRRWILYPPQHTIGSGSVSVPGLQFEAANALWVVGNFGPRPVSPEFVAWPPSGYIPYQLVPDRWSFSYSNANFSNAIISMISNNTTVQLELEPGQNGFGDNTLVWVPMGIPTDAPADDITYSVTIDNVLVSGEAKSFTYTVTIMDPTQYMTNLLITQFESPDPVMVGDNLTYRITVTNLGPAKATDVTLTDTLPAGVAFVSASSSQGDCSGIGPVTCDLGTLANGNTATVTVIVMPKSTGEINNTVSVTAIETDLDTTNNTAMTTTTAQPEPLTIGASALQEGEVGVLYDGSLEIGGGTPPYLVLKVKGSLPSGLSLDAAGNIIGIPLKAGSNSFTAKVTDQAGSSVIKPFKIKIVKALSITTKRLPMGKIGKKYLATLRAAGGEKPYTWSFTGSLPEGLSLDPATGKIKGIPIPTESGDFTLIFQVTDPLGVKVQQSLTISIF